MKDEKLLARKVRWNGEWVTIKDLAYELEVPARPLGVLVILKKMDPLDAFTLLLDNPAAAELFNYEYVYKGVEMTEQELCQTTGTTPQFLEQCKMAGIPNYRIMKYIEKGITSFDELPPDKRTKAMWSGVELTLEEISTVSGVSLKRVITHYLKHEEFPDDYGPDYVKEQERLRHLAAIENNRRHAREYNARRKEAAIEAAKKRGPRLHNLPRLLRDREKTTKLPKLPKLPSP